MGIVDFFKKGKEKPVAVSQNRTQPAATVEKAKPSPQPTQETYIVQKGDSLSKIAKKYYGDMNQWKKIFEANKEKIKDPDKIQIGQTLVIPK
jgi:nucleoid-associated protein YgaU